VKRQQQSRDTAIKPDTSKAVSSKTGRQWKQADQRQ